MHVPVASRVSVLPDTVHTDAVDEAHDTMSLLDAVARSVNGVCRRVNDEGSFNLSLWLALVMEMDFVTGAAAAKVASPLWLAVTVHVPVATNVSKFPETVHTAAVEDAYDTGRVLVAVPDSRYGVCRRVSDAGGLNVNVWLSRAEAGMAIHSAFAIAKEAIRTRRPMRADMCTPDQISAMENRVSCERGYTESPTRSAGRVSTDRDRLRACDRAG